MSAPARRPSQRVRVCCFCERWESGGIESFLHNVLLHMDLSKLEVDIVAARIDESVFTRPLENHGVRFYQLSGEIRSPANGQAFSDLLKRRNYDVVYLNIFQGLSFRYGYLAKKAGVPMRIAHSHGAGLRNSPGKGLKLCLHRLGRGLWRDSITDFWACSRKAAEFLFSKGREYRWIPNGIEAERFRFQPEFREIERHKLGLTENTFLVGSVGRLSEEKNHRFLLKVFYEIKKMRRNSVLLIVGTGRLEEQLRMQSRELGVEEDVIFYGVSPRVERLLWAMDIFIFPSCMEGLGIAGVEAQAAGLPILCSEHIPQEALVTDRVTQLSLSIGARTWAEAALNASVPPDRRAAVGEVSAAGYDVEAVAERIREAWMG